MIDKQTAIDLFIECCKNVKFNDERHHNINYQLDKTRWGFKEIEIGAIFIYSHYISSDCKNYYPSINVYEFVKDAPLIIPEKTKHQPYLYQLSSEEYEELKKLYHTF